MSDEIKLYQFTPIVNGDPLLTEDGEPIQFEIEAPVEHVKTVTIQTAVDGEVLKDTYILPDNVYDVLKWVGAADAEVQTSRVEYCILPQGTRTFAKSIGRIA